MYEDTQFPGQGDLIKPAPKFLTTVSGLQFTSLSANTQDSERQRKVRLKSVPSIPLDVSAKRPYIMERVIQFY